MGITPEEVKFYEEQQELMKQQQIQEFDRMQKLTTRSLTYIQAVAWQKALLKNQAGGSEMEGKDCQMPEFDPS